MSDIEQVAVEKLKELSKKSNIDIAGAQIRRTSSRFCLGVEHGDYNGTELFGVGTDRFIWFAYKPNGTNKNRLYSGNFPDDGVIKFEIGNVPLPQSTEVANTWASSNVISEVPGRTGSSVATKRHTDLAAIVPN